MKMENSRLTFLEPEFASFMRTSSDPNQQTNMRNVRSLKNNTRLMPTTTETSRGDNNTIPKSSPVSKLTRADSYRVKPKEPTMVTMSNIERRRKSKERRRIRSQSSPMFPQDIDVMDPNLGNSRDNISNESLKENETSEYKPSISRKKSFNALKELGLRRIIQETARPILKRSQSQKIIEKPVVVKRTNLAATDEDEHSDELKTKPSGPLFQATTLFVPGYDFKTKSSTLPRKSSTPQLPRRSSKERMSVLFDKVITRQSSSPCLLKRDSKEKMKKIEQQKEEKIIEKGTPPEKQRTPIITLSNESNERIASSPDDESSNSSNLVKQRQAALALRQKQFQDRGTTKSLDGTVTNSSKVKQLASGYDDGSAFVKVKNLANKTSELSLKDNTKDNTINSNDSISISKQTGNYTIEKPCALEYKGTSSYPPQNANPTYDSEYKVNRSYDADLNKGSGWYNSTGTESGYASLTDSMNLDKEIFANTWSHHDWRDFTSDLCVTEL